MAEFINKELSKQLLEEVRILVSEEEAPETRLISDHEKEIKFKGEFNKIVIGRVVIPVEGDICLIYDTKQKIVSAYGNNIVLGNDMYLYIYRYNDGLFIDINPVTSEISDIGEQTLMYPLIKYSLEKGYNGKLKLDLEYKSSNLYNDTIKLVSEESFDTFRNGYEEMIDLVKKAETKKFIITSLLENYDELYVYGNSLLYIVVSLEEEGLVCINLETKEPSRITYKEFLMDKYFVFDSEVLVMINGSRYKNKSRYYLNNEDTRILTPFYKDSSIRKLMTIHASAMNMPNTKEELVGMGMYEIYNEIRSNFYTIKFDILEEIEKDKKLMEIFEKGVIYLNESKMPIVISLPSIKQLELDEI